MKAFLDFETANKHGLACEFGLVSDSQEIDSLIESDLNDWDHYNTMFNFSAYLAIQDNHGSNFHEVMNEVESDVELWAWHHGTEIKVLRHYGYDNEVKCVAKLARSIYGKRPRGFYNLANFAQFLGIDFEQDAMHSAYYDAYVTKLVYENIKDLAAKSDNYIENGLKPKDIIEADVDFTLDIQDKTVCITGSIEGYSKSEIGKRIESLGGTWSKSLTKKVDILVVGDTGRHGITSKIKDAHKNGIALVSFEAFLKL